MSPTPVQTQYEEADDRISDQARSAPADGASSSSAAGAGTQHPAASGGPQLDMTPNRQLQTDSSVITIPGTEGEYIAAGPPEAHRLLDTPLDQVQEPQTAGQQDHPPPTTDGIGTGTGTGNLFARVAATTRDDRIRWWTFASQCVISIMIVVSCIVMLCKANPGSTSLYLTILTGVLASYLPSTELYAKFTKAAGTPLNQQSPAANTAAASGTAQQQQQQEQKQGQQQEQREDDLNHSPDQLARQIAGSNHPASAADVQMNMARFAMLNLLSVTILTLCMAKISAARDALPHGSVAGEVVPAENFYLPVITAVHGFYMPPPGQKKNPVV